MHVWLALEESEKNLRSSFVHHVAENYVVSMFKMPWAARQADEEAQGKGYYLETL